jgi:hypothetical protein
MWVALQIMGGRKWVNTRSCALRVNRRVECGVPKGMDGPWVGSINICSLTSNAQKHLVLMHVLTKRILPSTSS